MGAHSKPWAYLCCGPDIGPPHYQRRHHRRMARQSRHVKRRASVLPIEQERAAGTCHQGRGLRLPASAAATCNPAEAKHLPARMQTRARARCRRRPHASPSSAGSRPLWLPAAAASPRCSRTTRRRRGSPWRPRSAPRAARRRGRGRVDRSFLRGITRCPDAHGTVTERARHLSSRTYSGAGARAHPCH